jgi:hypothetical protein
MDVADKRDRVCASLCYFTSTCSYDAISCAAIATSKSCAQPGAYDVASGCATWGIDASPIVLGRHVLFGSLDGNVFAFDAS